MTSLPPSFPLLWIFLAALAGGILAALVFYWRLSRRDASVQVEIATLVRDKQHLEKSEASLELEVSDLRQQNLALSGNNSALAVQLESATLRAQEQIALLEHTRSTMAKEFENLANRIFDNKQASFSRSSRETLDTTVAPLRKELADFRKKVEDVYDKESAQRNRLEGKIGELQNQTQQIGQDAIKLANALKGDNKFQGNWGELILERLLEESGLRKGREYQTQVALQDEQGRRRNPDVILHLPDQRDIVIDAKVSLKDYECFCRSDDEQQRGRSLKAHIASLRAHVTGLNRKAYEQLEGINSLDFVLIFIPVEAAFMLAIEHDHQLFSDAYDKGIILVSPSTLLATLRTIHNIWRYADQNLNAEKIAAQAGGLYDQFVLLAEGLEDIGRHLDKSQEAWTSTRKRLISGRGNLLKRVEGLKTLGARTRREMPVKLADDAQLAEQTVLPEPTDDSDLKR
ncbi:MAG: DNA recombination protein RmuC [Gammaproteobacteria bacterium]|nr:DNA recombination protein RmuC [Gammaproteobacteria bacterium]MBQ0838764.1 DNA recombination protein RmuC [Gammaproteobacteria bacterium]